MAPSEQAAQSRYEEHILEAHVREVDADVPDGAVQVRYGEDEEWRTVSREEARRLHEDVHDAADGR